jgi:hypothetical protein
MDNDGDKAISAVIGELDQLTTWARQELSSEVSGALMRALDESIALLRTIAPGLPSEDPANTSQIADDWASVVANIPVLQANQLSERLVHLSARLAACFRELRNSGRGEAAVIVRDFMGYLYADILRPLWAAFPHLEPPEMGS